MTQSGEPIILSHEYRTSTTEAPLVDPPEESGLPTWAYGVIVAAIVALVSFLSYVFYRHREKKQEEAEEMKRLQKEEAAKKQRERQRKRALEEQQKNKREEEELRQKQEEVKRRNATKKELTGAEASREAARQRAGEEGQKRQVDDERLRRMNEEEEQRKQAALRRVEEQRMRVEAVMEAERQTETQMRQEEDQAITDRKLEPLQPARLLSLETPSIPTNPYFVSNYQESEKATIVNTGYKRWQDNMQRKLENQEAARIKTEEKRKYEELKQKQLVIDKYRIEQVASSSSDSSSVYEDNDSQGDTDNTNPYYISAFSESAYNNYNPTMTVDSIGLAPFEIDYPSAPLPLVLPSGPAPLELPPTYSATVEYPSLVDAPPIQTIYVESMDKTDDTYHDQY